MKNSRTRITGWAVAAACATACALPGVAGATTPTTSSGAGGRSVQLCNGTWHPAPTKGLPTSFNAYDVKVFGANDVVLAGLVGDIENSTAAVATWNGKRWTSTKVPGALADEIVGASSDALFVSATDAEFNPLVLRFNGSKWSKIPAPPVLDSDGTITAVASQRKGDLWLSGWNYGAAGAVPVIAHYTNGKWHTVANNLATTPWSVPLDLEFSPQGQLWLVGEDVSSSDAGAAIRSPYAGKLVGNRIRRVELPSVPGQPSTMPNDINWTRNGTMVVSGWTGSDATFVGYPYSSTRNSDGRWRLQSRRALTTGSVLSNVSAIVGDDVWSADDNMLLDKSWTGLTRWQGKRWSKLHQLSSFAGYHPAAMDGDERGNGWLVGFDDDVNSRQWRICGSPRTTRSGTMDATGAGTPVTVGKRPATTSVGPRGKRTTRRPTVGAYDGLARPGADATTGTAPRERLRGPSIDSLRKARPAGVTATDYVAEDACAAPESPHAMRCDAKVVATRTGSTVRAAATGVPAGYGPKDFRAAYKLPKTGGKGRTVAVVAAHGYPALAKDLAKYRKATGLPACTVQSGCLTIEGQDGGKPPSTTDKGWALEQALDVQAVSATCPDCKILVVEADTTSDADLGAANHQAATHKPFVINNSFGRTEWSTDRTPASSMVPKGTPLVASTGDYGLLPSYPSTVPSVVGVGGTTLLENPGSKRGWAEHLWSLSGGGCSAVQPKPAFQRQSFCGGNRSSSVAVVADADPASGAAVYDSTGFDGQKGWFVLGGTSLASPLTAGMYAVRGIKPSVAQLWSGRRTTNRVTGGGSNGWCAPKIECTAKANTYSGASGWGSLAG